MRFVDEKLVNAPHTDRGVFIGKELAADGALPVFLHAAVAVEAVLSTFS